MDEKMRAFLRLMKGAFFLAKLAHECSLDDEESKRKEDKCSAMAYAAACLAKCSAAEAVYWTTPELEHEEIPDLFAKFDTFAQELLQDFSTDHSRQWVDIEFSRLEECFNDSVCSQRIPE